MSSISCWLFVFFYLCECVVNNIIIFLFVQINMRIVLCLLNWFFGVDGQIRRHLILWDIHWLKLLFPIFNDILNVIFVLEFLIIFLIVIIFTMLLRIYRNNILFNFFFTINTNILDNSARILFALFWIRWIPFHFFFLFFWFLYWGLNLFIWIARLRCWLELFLDDLFSIFRLFFLRSNYFFQSII